MTIRSGTPAFLRVAADLRAKIEDGTLPTGAQLPSMTQLREMYDVSNTVVRDALNELRRDGLIVGQQGKGVFVRDATSGDDTGEGDDAIMCRLSELTDAVRQLDARMTRLEQDGDRER